VVEVTIVVRELGRSKPDYSLKFSLPALPRPGDYISVFRPDKPRHSEDVVVRKVWWHLHHGETRGVVSNNDEIVGRVKDIVIECEQAIGPYAGDRWRDVLERADERGILVERFDVERLTLREDEI
jgi:hypothetical protein